MKVMCTVCLHLFGCRIYVNFWTDVHWLNFLWWNRFLLNYLSQTVLKHQFQQKQYFVMRSCDIYVNITLMFLITHLEQFYNRCLRSPCCTHTFCFCSCRGCCNRGVHNTLHKYVVLQLNIHIIISMYHYFLKGSSTYNYISYTT